MRAEDDLAIGKVPVAGDVAGGSTERFLVLGLDAVLAAAVVLYESKDVRGQRRARRDPRQVRALLLLLQPDTRQLHGAQGIGFVFGEPALDISELPCR